jgi:hypothetical protein
MVLDFIDGEMSVARGNWGMGNGYWKIGKLDN